METMRAAMYGSYGGPEVLYVVDVPVPEVSTGEVLVRVHASSVNGGELNLRAGKLRLLTGRSFPKKVGIDFVGEVAARGADVTSVQVGDRVWGTVEEMEAGATAQYTLARPEKMALAPRSLSAVEAVSLLAGGTMAITALRDHARLKPGERLLVRGASGGVGSLAATAACSPERGGWWRSAWTSPASPRASDISRRPWSTARSACGSSAASPAATCSPS